jgi:predicted NBD/HSP70 family sugar kinase
MTRAFRAEPGKLGCRAIFEWAAQDDPIARWILDRRIEMFAAALAGLLHAFDPEIVILTGQIAEAGDALSRRSAAPSTGAPTASSAAKSPYPAPASTTPPASPAPPPSGQADSTRLNPYKHNSFTPARV